MPATSGSKRQQSYKLGLGLMLALFVHWIILQAMPRLSDKLPASFNNTPPLQLSLQNPGSLPAGTANAPSSTTRSKSKPLTTTETLEPSPLSKPEQQPGAKSPKTAAKTPKSPTRSLPDASELMANSLAIASSDSDIWDLDQQGPEPGLRHKTITSGTQEPEYRSYLTAWVRKIEAIGRMNYPTDKQQRQLSGKMTLDVALDANGHIQHIDLITSSGNPQLDQAAINIVKLAAPYAPLPANILKQTDILHIRRQWVFADGSAQFP